VLSGSGFADLCVSLDEQSILLGLKRGVVPRGAADAGLYSRDDSARTVADCIASCCLTPTCEVGVQYAKWISDFTFS
jgi:hypothetical protein